MNTKESMQSRGYRFLLADADDTLFDFPAGERLAFTQTFQAFELPADESAFALYRQINETLWRRLERGEITPARLRVQRFEELLAALPTGKAHRAFDISQRFVEEMGRQALLLPGAEAAVRRWFARVPLAIVTNGIAEIQRARLARSAIAPYVSALIISEEVGAPKPDRRMVDAALSAVHCQDPRQALLLGDSLEADIAAAKNAGVDSCWYNPRHLPNTSYTPTHTVAALGEVDALLCQEAH
jgi:YjjG family noncanonical pyrimidine nucleotidase